MKTPQEESRKERFMNKLSAFLQRNRLLMIIVAVVIIGGLIGVGVWNEVRKNIQEESTQMAVEAQELFDQWESASEEDKKAELADEIVTKIDAIKEKYPKRYANQRAQFILGRLYFARDQFAEAAEVYSGIAESFPDSYLAPLSLVNAGVAYEAADNSDSAAEMYKAIIDKHENAVQVPHALFSLGRLSEANDDIEKAAEYYQRLIDNHGNSSWTNLARNRIIYFKAGGLLSES
ncbi:MAG: tetratricopeptide repeat protein [Spirochaetales bacterium]|nr:tetratricopeptide repeat protein [Spirochaetales bacterium]